jgi:Protein of unknown function (DUF4232)
MDRAAGAARRGVLPGAAAAAVLAVLGGAAAGCSGGGAAPSATSPADLAGGAGAPGAPVCAAGQVTVRIGVPSVGVAGGTAYYLMQVTNVSKRPCALDGFPAVAALGGAGLPVGSPAVDDRDYRPAAVLVPAGGIAHSVLGVGAAAHYAAAACDPVRAAAVRVALPGQPGTVALPFPFDDCAAPGARLLSVTPVSAGPVSHDGH